MDIRALHSALHGQAKIVSLPLLIVTGPRFFNGPKGSWA